MSKSHSKNAAKLKYCCLAEWRGNGLKVSEAQSFRSAESNSPAPEWQSNVKNTSRASGTVPNVYLCSCKQKNSPLESVVWTRRKLSDLIIGQTHLLPVKTIICSSSSARAPVQISEAANCFLPAASGSGLKLLLVKHPEVLKTLAMPPTGLE